MQKRLNLSRCHLRANACRPKEPCIRWVSRSPRDRAILGVVQPNEQLWVSAALYAKRAEYWHASITAAADWSLSRYIVPV